MPEDDNVDVLRDVTSPLVTNNEDMAGVFFVAAARRLWCVR